MNARYREIAQVFAAAGVEGFARLPDSVEARRKFAKDFVELNGYLDAAKVQGFMWEQAAYEHAGAAGQRDGSVRLELDERTYLILVQRYKELFVSAPGGVVPDAPYDLDGHITEIDTGLIDTDYMNANFKKWLKVLGDNDEVLEAASRELHRSFATLSQDEQRLAELFLHDVERGDVQPENDKTLRDYITSYARREKDNQVDALVEMLGVDRSLLVEMMGQDLSEGNINAFGRFDALKASVDKRRARDAFERVDGKPVPLFRVNMRAADLLKKFILEGGFDVRA